MGGCRRGWVRPPPLGVHKHMPDWKMHMMQHCTAAGSLYVRESVCSLVCVHQLNFIIMWMRGEAEERWAAFNIMCVKRRYVIGRDLHSARLLRCITYFSAQRRLRGKVSSFKPKHQVNTRCRVNLLAVISRLNRARSSLCALRQKSFGRLVTSLQTETWDDCYRAQWPRAQKTNQTFINNIDLVQLAKKLGCSRARLGLD